MINFFIGFGAGILFLILICLLAVRKNLTGLTLKTLKYFNEMQVKRNNKKYIKITK